MLIVGAGGHAKEVLDVLLPTIKNGIVYFFDDTKGKLFKIHDEYDVIYDEIDVKKLFQSDMRFYLGVGTPTIRCKLTEKMLQIGGELAKVISNSSIVSNYSSIEGDIMHQVFVGSNVHIGVGALINFGSQVHHDVIVGKYAEVGPGSILLGNSKVGDFSRIGSNATILPKVKVGNNSIIGAGALVTKDIPPNSIAYGVPAKVVKTI